MKKIRILLMLPQQQIGGAEVQILNLVRNINKNKFKMYLGTLYQNKELKEEFTNIPDVETVNFNKKGKLDILVYFKIAKFARKNKIDIINTFLSNHHAYIPCFIYRKCAPLGGIRSTYTDKSLINKLLRFGFLRIASKTKNMYVVSNSHTGKEIYTHNKFPEQKVLVVPNGIDYNKFSKGNGKKIIDEFGLQGKVVLGMISRIDERKNHEELIECFSALEKKYPNLRLIIVGNGPHLNKLKNITENKKLSQKIIFTGLRKDIPDLLNAMDIFVFPSRFPEGWPNAIGEAMSAGIPVISYPCGDAVHIIKNKHNGIITEPNVNSFKKNLEILIRNKKLRNILSANGKKTILDKFTISHMVKKYEQIYNKIIRR